MRALALLAALALASPVHAAPLQVLTENNPPFNFAEGKEVKGTSTEAVRALLAKAGVEATIAVRAWDEAYASAQRSANVCVYGTARVENREKLFKWYGPIGSNVWALYALPSFDKKIETARDARFFRIGGVKNDAKVDFMRAEGASSIREADRDSDNPARLAKPKNDPVAIDLWITSQATAKAMAATAGVKELKEVLVVKTQDLYLACNPRTEKAILDKLEAASRR
ncbi:MAG: transporter substrate-binding domain-containing protein [Burkholderiales bacterium]|nr:transporter substrate-binding domain-containing protein [Burkholderiales bacterium]